MCGLNRLQEISIGYSAEVKTILHYVLGLCFGKVCEQKGEQKQKNKRIATGSRFFPMHSVI